MGDEVSSGQLSGHQTGITVECLLYCKPRSGSEVDYTPTGKDFLFFLSKNKSKLLGYAQMTDCDIWGRISLNHVLVRNQRAQLLHVSREGRADSLAHSINFD